MNVDIEDGLAIDDRTRVLVLTGSGVSTESGIPACSSREPVWEGRPLHWLASGRSFAEDPELVWRFYSARREEARRRQPNPAHLALALLEEALGDRFLLVTQNVDGLHGRAGSRRLVELHGSLLQSRCAHCDRPAFLDEESYGADKVALCTACDEQGRMGLLRPNVVWFGEPVDPACVGSIEEFLADAAAARERLVLLVAGTSGRVLTAATVVERAREAGAETWLVNQEPATLDGFDHVLPGRCGRILPDLISKGLGRLRALRELIRERTLELIVPLPDGSRSATGVTDRSGAEMLTLALNGTRIRDWRHIVARAGPERTGKASIAFYGREHPTCVLDVDFPVTACARRGGDSVAVGERLYAADRTNAGLTLRVGRVVERVPCEELPVPGFFFDCTFPPDPPPAGAVVFDEYGCCVGFVEETEPGGEATVLPADYRIEPQG